MNQLENRFYREAPAARKPGRIKQSFTVFIPVSPVGIICGTCGSANALQAKAQVAAAKSTAWGDLYKLGWRIVKFTGIRKGGAK